MGTRTGVFGFSRDLRADLERNFQILLFFAAKIFHKVSDGFLFVKNECRRTLVRWICQRNEMKIRETNERVKAITERLDTINKTEQARFEQKLQQEISQFCESPEGRILPQTEVHLSSGSSGQNRAPYTEMPAASDHHDL